MNLVSNLMSGNNYDNQQLSQGLVNNSENYDAFPAAPQRAENQEQKTSDIQRDENGHAIMEFYTDYGVQRVSIDGDLQNGQPVIMTYHDIGINHNACFLSFFNMMKAYDTKFRYFNIVHIDAPQHHPKSSSRIAGTKQTSSTVTTTTKGDVDAFDLLELSSQIEEIRNKLQVDRFLAFGVGASCNVWTHYATNYSHRMRGMVLLNPVNNAASWTEWMFDVLLGKLGTSSQYLCDSFESSLFSRYFPVSVAPETYDAFNDEFDKIDTQQSLKFFRGFVRRQPLSEKQLNKITTKTLVIAGEMSKVREECIQFQKMMPRQYTTFVLIPDAGFLLTESDPQKLCSSVDLFAESLGVTTISMESKFGKLESLSDETEN